jgi:RecA/RadA recombinase
MSKTEFEAELKAELEALNSPLSKGLLDKLADLKKNHNIKPLSSFKKLQVNLDVLETGVFPADMAIAAKSPDGRLGLRAKDICEIFGEPGVGKSAYVEEMILQTLKRYGPYSVGALYAEPPEIERMEAKGINVDHILARVAFDSEIDPKKNLAEDQLESLLAMAEDPNVRLIIIDSLGALMTALTLFEKNGKDYRDVDEKVVAAVANIFNSFLLQFMHRNKNAVLVMINHYKETIDTSYGFSSDLIKTPAGRLKEFLATVRIWFRGTKDMGERHSVEDTKSAIRIKNVIQIIKNKYSHSTNHRTVRAVFDLKTGKYNNEEKLIEYGAFFGTLKKWKDDKKKERKAVISELTPGIAQSGAWTYIGNGEDFKSFNGTAKAVEYLLQNPDIYDKIKLQIYQRSEVFFEDDKPNFESQIAED